MYSSPKYNNQHGGTKNEFQYFNLCKKPCQISSIICKSKSSLNIAQYWLFTSTKNQKVNSHYIYSSLVFSFTPFFSFFGTLFFPYTFVHFAKQLLSLIAIWFDFVWMKVNLLYHSIARSCIFVHRNKWIFLEITVKNQFVWDWCNKLACKWFNQFFVNWQFFINFGKSNKLEIVDYNEIAFLYHWDDAKIFIWKIFLSPFLPFFMWLFYMITLCGAQRIYLLTFEQ